MTTQSSMLAVYDNNKESLFKVILLSLLTAPLSSKHFSLGCLAGHVWKELGENV